MIRFHFRPQGDHHVDMEVVEHAPNQRIVWRCKAGPWENTSDFSFTIEPAEQGSVLKFANRGWKDADDFYMRCNAKWGFFLTVSLKNYLESGTGVPHPNEPSI